MGPNGAKMQDFEVFAESIQKLQKDINDVKNLELKDLKHSKPAIAKLKCIFKGINIMKSGTKLVGNSKVMAHLFPQLIPPIDREYTLSLIHNGNKSIKNDPDAEWETMINILSHFFLPIASETRFQKKAKKWLNNPEQCYWDTSVPKIIDNLIIGAKPRRRKHKREA